MDDLHRLERLVAIMDTLRGPDGCPWDREQDERSLRRFLIEEAYEAAEAIDLDDGAGLCEELGDLLLQIVFLARLGAERGRFTIDDVVRSISEKMIRRHPHVFGDDTVETSDEVLHAWERIKRDEKGEPPADASALDGVPAALPALQRAEALGAKAARVGFDWAAPEDVLDKVEEELAELREALAGGEPDAVRHEAGDLLFAVAMFARRAGIDAEAALEATNRRFHERFRIVERTLAAEGGSLPGADLQTLERLWRHAKRAADDAQTT